MRFPSTAPLCIVFLLAPLAACGGGGGAGGPDQSASGAAPSAAVHFPPARSMTDAPVIAVRGTAADPEGVAAVRVDGLEAVTTDAFATWRVDVPLTEGANPLVVETEDVLGNVDTAAARVDVERRPPLLDRAAAMAVAPGATHAFLLDDRTASVHRVDLATGERTVTNPDFDAAALGFGEARELVYAPARDRLYAIAGSRIVHQAVGGATLSAMPPGGNASMGDLEYDALNDVLWICTSRAILRVDPDTGARTVVSDASTGSGPALSFVADVALDPGAGTLYALDLDLDAVLAVDMITGARSILAGIEATTIAAGEGAVYAADGVRDETVLSRIASDGTVTPLPTPGGAAPPLHQAWELAFADGGLLVLDIGLSAVLRVDPVSGLRTDAWRSRVGEGEAIQIPVAAVPLPGTSTAAVTDLMARRILAVDPVTGTRTVVSGPARGTGVAMRAPYGLVSDGGGQLLVVDALAPSLLLVDPGSGARSELLGPAVGFASALTTPTQIVRAASGRLFAYDTNRILELDLLTEEVTVLSGPGQGSGPEFNTAGLVSLTFPPGSPTLLAATTAGRLFAIDTTSGNRLERPPIEPGPIEEILFLAPSPAAGDLLVGGRGLMRFNPVTGAQRRVSDDAIGRGPLARFLAAAEDASLRVALVCSVGSFGVVDLVSGDRVVVAR